MHTSCRMWMCLGLLLIVLRASNADIKPVITLTDGTGVALVHVGSDAIHVLHFRRTVMAENIVKPLNDSQKVRQEEPTILKTLPASLPADLSPKGRMQIGGIMGAMSFYGGGFCRPFDVLALSRHTQRRTEKAGILWAFVDETRAFAKDGPFPETLPPASASCAMPHEKGKDYIICVPEAWPTELQRDGAELPRFVRLTQDTDNKWGCGKEFFVFATLPGNPFAAKIGKNVRIVQIVRSAPQTVVAVSADGVCAAYNFDNGRWTEPVMLLRSDNSQVAGVSAINSGYIVLWRSRDNVLMSGITKDFRPLTETPSEKLLLTDISQVTASSAGNRVWVVALRRTKVRNTLIAAVRQADAREWSSWYEIAAVSGTSDVAIEACAVSDQGALYVAATDRTAGKTSIYAVVSTIAPDSDRLVIAPHMVTTSAAPTSEPTVPVVPLGQFKASPDDKRSESRE
jgi:hypothetical protein